MGNPSVPSSKIKPGAGVAGALVALLVGPIYGKEAVGVAGKVDKL